MTLDGEDITETEINNDSNNNSTSEGITQEGYDDDDEPTGSSIGKSLLFELNRYKHQLRRQATIKIRGSHKKENYLWDGDDSNDDDDVDGHGGGSNCDSSVQGDDSDNNNGPPIVTAVIIVRYFQKRLIGVTCGRLKSVYGRAARLTLHRHLYGTSKAYVERYTFGRNNERNLYGLGAGDTELILDVVPVLVGNKEKEEEGAKQITGEGVNYEQEEIKEQQNVIVRKLVSELHFEGEFHCCVNYYLVLSNSALLKLILL